jgi:hypothetical protein
VQKRKAHANGQANEGDGPASACMNVCVRAHLCMCVREA